MKITVIGGGSTYTPELVSGFLNLHSSLPVSELCLMDIDPQRLEVVGGFARRMVEARGAPFRVTLSSDQRAAVSGAAYVTTQLRVGQMQARKADEYLGRRHGLIGQETTGVGGMAKALRTIPVILKIAADMAELAPGATLVNFTNPSGLVTQALSKYAPQVPVMGVCNGPYTTQVHLSELLGHSLGQEISSERVRIDILGLNHLSFVRGLTLDGEEMWPQVMQQVIGEQKSSPDPDWDPRTLEMLGMVPSGYLRYFYYTARMLEKQQHWPPSRAEAVMEVEKELLRKYADPTLRQPPPELMKRGGAYYSTVATRLLNSHYNNLGETHVVNVRQAGAVPGWPEDWVLELACRVDAGGAQPLPAAPLPPAVFGLLAQVKSYELLAAEAAVHGDRKAAFQALLVHPLGPPADQVQAVLDDLLETHRAYLPQFFN